MQLEKKGTRREASKQVQELQNRRGAAVFFQKINIEKAFKEEPSALLGITRKLVDVKKSEIPLFSQVTRTKESQSFVAKVENHDYIISSDRKNNLWVAS